MTEKLPIVHYGSSEWLAWYHYYRDTKNGRAHVMQKYGKGPTGWTVPTLYPPVIQPENGRNSGDQPEAPAAGRSPASQPT